MIITLSLNPSIDNTLDVENYKHRGVNNIINSETDAGGKGINTAKNLKMMGKEPITVGFIAGDSGVYLKKMLDKSGIKNDFIPVYGETRTNTKIIEENGEITELNEKGPDISEERIKELMFKLEGYAVSGGIFVLSGNSKNCSDQDIYRKIISLAHSRDVRTVVGIDSENPMDIIFEKPEVLKFKLKDICRMKNISEEKADDKFISNTMKELIESGIDIIALSCGEKGAYFADKSGVIKCPGLKIKKHSTVGAGDAMLAGLVYGYEKKLGLEKIAELSMAMSAGAIATIGTKPPSKENVEELKGMVEKIYLT